MTREEIVLGRDGFKRFSRQKQQRVIGIDGPREAGNGWGEARKEKVW